MGPVVHAMTTPAPRVFLASWLDKKMEWRFVYEHRYFILDGTRLSYRLEEHGVERKFGSIISFDPWRENSQEDTSKGYCFTVWLQEGGTWALRAATREIYDSWAQALFTVLAPSAVASAVASENGRMWSSRDTSTFADTVSPAGTPSPRHLESEGLGIGSGAALTNGVVGLPVRRTLSVGAVKGVGRDALPAPSDHLDESRESVGVSGSAEGSTLSVARVSAAAAQTTVSVSPSEVVLLSSMVEKETAWRGRWKPRFVELREGRILVIKSSADSHSERQRYVLEAVDASPLSHQAVWLLFTASNGDRFWVRYGSVEECHRWYSLCRRLLHAEASWHWLPLAEDDAGRSLRLRQMTSGDYSDLHVQYHCAAMVPPFQEGRWSPLLFVFGGAKRWCKQVFNPKARSFLPHAENAHMTGSLLSLELAGPHLIQAWKPMPFPEGPHALVCPHARYGGSLTCMPGEAATPAMSDSSSRTIAARLVLFGGILSGGYQPPTTELWSVWCTASLSTTGEGQRWDRHDIPSYELPMLAFHDTLFVPWKTAAQCAAADETGRCNSTAEAPQGSGFLLVTGGLDVEFRCRAECYAVLWEEALTDAPDQAQQGSSVGAEETRQREDKVHSAKPVVFAFGLLPEPRAFHRTTVLSDGTVVLVGGRGVEGAVVNPSVMTLAPQTWRRACRSWGAGSSPGAPMGQPAAKLKHKEKVKDGMQQQQSVQNPTEKWCSLTSSDEEDESRTCGADGASLSPQWLGVHYEGRVSAASSTTLRSVAALPNEMGDVAVSTTAQGNRVVVMGQVSQPCQDVRLYLLDFDTMPSSPPARGGGVRSQGPGLQFLPGTRHVRCYEVLLFVGAVPNRLVGVTLHIFNDYLYVIGGGTVDKSKGDPYELCGPLRILLE